MPVTDNPDYVDPPMGTDAQDTLYITREMVADLAGELRTTGDLLGLLPLEARMTPEHLARLRSTRDRLYRVRRILGDEAAMDVLEGAIIGYMADNGTGVTDRLEAALEVIENA